MNVRTATMEDVVEDVKQAPPMQAPPMQAPPMPALQPNQAMQVPAQRVFTLEATLAMVGQPIFPVELRPRHDQRNLQQLMDQLEAAAQNPLDVASIKERDGWRATYPSVLKRAQAFVTSLEKRWNEYETLKSFEITAQNLHAAMRVTNGVIFLHFSF